MNCFGLDNNFYIYLIIILLVLCVFKNGGICGLFNNCYTLPVIIALVCCFCKGGGNLFGGCGCK